MHKPEDCVSNFFEDLDNVVLKFFIDQMKLNPSIKDSNGKTAYDLCKELGGLEN